MVTVTGELGLQSGLALKLGLGHGYRYANYCCWQKILYEFAEGHESCTIHSSIEGIAETKK